jgi:hypothetical protein
MKPRPPWWLGDARHHALASRFETCALSHSANFDQRRRPETLRTAMATAFFCPTRTTSVRRTTDTAPDEMTSGLRKLLGVGRADAPDHARREVLFDAVD